MTFVVGLAPHCGVPQVPTVDVVLAYSAVQLGLGSQTCCLDPSVSAPSVASKLDWATAEAAVQTESHRQMSAHLPFGQQRSRDHLIRLGGP